jgi:hypothetical protein
VEEGLSRDFTNYGASAEEAIRQRTIVLRWNDGFKLNANLIKTEE